MESISGATKAASDNPIPFVIALMILCFLVAFAVAAGAHLGWNLIG